MEIVDIEKAVAGAIEIIIAPKTMARNEKLLRWADIVRSSDQPLRLYHLMERWRADILERPINQVFGVPCSAIMLASADPVFRQMGLPAPDVITTNDVMNFFEVTQTQLHAFSCDCGGTISNAQQAASIEAMIS